VPEKTLVPCDTVTVTPPTGLQQTACDASEPGPVTFQGVEIKVQLKLGSEATPVDLVEVVDEGSEPLCGQEPTFEPQNGVGSWKYDCTVTNWDTTTIKFAASTNGGAAEGAGAYTWSVRAWCAARTALEGGQRGGQWMGPACMYVCGLRTRLLEWIDLSEPHLSTFITHLLSPDLNAAACAIALRPFPAPRMQEAAPTKRR
jgi:hypothetical protein